MNTIDRATVNGMADLPLFSSPINTTGTFSFLPTIPTAERMCDECHEKPVSLPNNPRCHFCSNECAQKANHRRTWERQKQIRDTPVSGGSVKPSASLSDADIEAVCLYRECKLGLGSISKAQGRDKKLVRDSLIKAGVYRPDPKHNGVAKKGTGAQSRMPSPEELERRQAEKQRKADEKTKLKRTMVAKALILCWRKGYRFERAQKEIGHPISNHYSAAVKSPTIERLYRKWPKVGFRYSLSNTTRTGNRLSYSRQFKYEAAFSDHVEQRLLTMGCVYKREWGVGDNTRCDFYIPAIRLLIECKVDARTKECHTAAGQCFNYRRNGYSNIMILMPDDVVIDAERMAELTHAAKVCYARNLEESLSSVLNNENHSHQ
jgi:hypothetical protein